MGILGFLLTTLEMNNNFGSGIIFSKNLLKPIEQFTDLDMLNFVEVAWWLGFRLEPIFAFATAASKIILNSKVDKIYSKKYFRCISLNPSHTR